MNWNAIRPAPAVPDEPGVRRFQPSAGTGRPEDDGHQGNKVLVQQLADMVAWCGHFDQAGSEDHYEQTVSAVMQGGFKVVAEQSTDQGSAEILYVLSGEQQPQCAWQ